MSIPQLSSRPNATRKVYLNFGGATVTHNGQTWESTHAANVWEPGVFGWAVV